MQKKYHGGENTAFQLNTIKMITVWNACFLLLVSNVYSYCFCLGAAVQNIYMFSPLTANCSSQERKILQNVHVMQIFTWHKQQRNFALPSSTWQSSTIVKDIWQKFRKGWRPLHCTKNNLNLRIETESIMPGADKTEMSGLLYEYLAQKIRHILYT